MVVIVSVFGCVYHSPSNGSTTATPFCTSRLRTRYERPRWKYTGALMHGAERPPQLDAAHHLTRRAIDDRHLLRRCAAQAHLRGRVAVGLPSTNPAGRFTSPPLATSASIAVGVSSGPKNAGRPA